jgi:hypothetical protein
VRERLPSITSCNNEDVKKVARMDSERFGLRKPKVVCLFSVLPDGQANAPSA